MFFLKNRGRNKRHSLFNKIMALVIAIFIFTSFVLFISSWVSSRIAATAMEASLSATFNDLFSNLSFLFERLDRQARENIQKTSGLIDIQEIKNIAIRENTAFQNFASQEAHTIGAEASRAAAIFEKTAGTEAEDMADAMNVFIDETANTTSVKQKQEAAAKIKGTLNKIRQRSRKKAKVSKRRLDSALNRLHREYPERLRAYGEKVRSRIGDETKSSAGATVAVVGKAASLMTNAQKDVETKMADVKKRSDVRIQKGLQKAGTTGIIILAISLCGAALVCMWIASIMVQRFTEPTVAIVDVLKEMAEGNLAMDVRAAESSDEIGDMAESFNRFAAQLRAVVSNILINAERLSHTSSQFSAISEQTNESITQLNSTIVNIARGASSQLSRVCEVEKVFNELADDLKSAAANARAAMEKSMHSVEQAHKGKAAAEQLRGKMNRIVSVSEQASVAIQQLKESSREISDIVTTITTFADQTNLLSLNASIEAARAGDAGRGFAVVADEVRKLAEGSSVAASKISNLVRNIIQEIDTTVALVGDERREAEEGVKIVESTALVQDALFQMTSHVKELVSQIADFSTAQLAATEEAVNSVRNVAGIAEQNAADTQELSSTTEEVTATMQELNANAIELARSSVNLKDSVSQFKITEHDKKIADES